LTDDAELLSNVDARGCVEDYQSTNVDSGSEKSRMAPLAGQDSQRKLQTRVNGSKLVPVDGAGHEIYVDRAEEC
jgi:hypothetical protein